MSQDKRIWIQHIMAILSQRRGQHVELKKALEAMEPQALEELFRVLQAFEQDLHQAEHTWRPFPGGPRIRV
jgi:hypothetical protein